MIALLQRVTHASVVVDDETVGAIDAGLMTLVCAERGDTEKEADALLAKLLSYRVFSDEAGKMNRSVIDVQGGLLLVPQFTLAADTQSRHASVVYPCCSAGYCARVVRLFCRCREEPACACCDRAVRR